MPELRDVPAKHVHEPAASPDGVPDGYPEPIVDHKEERVEALDALREDQAVTHPDLVVPARFNGPARSGNGGYVAGSLAARVPDAADRPVEVTLRRPPPLDRR